MTRDLDEVQRELERRARAVAEAVSDDGPEGDTVPLLVVEVGPDRYAIELSHVLEIESVEDIAAIPGVPSFWRGLINLRGTLRPVLDLGMYLGISGPADDEEDQTVVLVAAAGVDVAVRVGRVVEIRNEPLDEIMPLFGDAASGRGDLYRGVAPDMTAVLDAAALLGSADLRVNQDSG